MSVAVDELEHDERCLLDATQKPLVSTGFLRPPRDFSLVSADRGGQPLSPGIGFASWWNFDAAPLLYRDFVEDGHFEVEGGSVSDEVWAKEDC